ncbi:MAG: hypothetical protein KKF46_03960 [Nanoarchaeota archaeon]|nr:hypothetical protein [Nanoarchaeota archaeon]MBU1321489.1 hypothetical protein [Nanoarchaeota archaeon]MBU1597373.1 hypothetical protein [Nanoarchaeota archaeon]MBU2441214.1 hypothetical protein [Nanoarchaeota archaeon]
MALRNDLKREYERKAWEERVKKNPLLTLSLGDLVMEMHKIYAADPYVVKPEDQVPESSLENRTRYHAIVKELNKREFEYTRVPISERRF